MKPSFTALPFPLLAFLLSSPLLAFSAPTSPNDPLRAIAEHSPKPPEQPVCCLTPLPPLEPPREEENVLLLSFEDWKARQLAKVRDNSSGNGINGAGRGGAVGEGGAEESVPPEPAGASDPVSLAPSHPEVSDMTSGGESTNGPTEQLSPHFRVPLTDRFNYASLDCSARVHTTHRSAKSPHAILTSKRDRYMLSPCSNGVNGEEQFVVVELCEDIRIDTVQLANFEFFSGVFKDFTVSVAKTYEMDKAGWTVAGRYKAKNVRAVQSFHPPTTLRDFYRYIRIDFHSHYSSEYYCPVSLLRVYGLTHLEQWKWDIWESESKTKRDRDFAGEVAGSGAEAADAHAPRPTQASLVEAVVEGMQTKGTPPDTAGSGEDVMVTRALKEESLGAAGGPQAVSSTQNGVPDGYSDKDTGLVNNDSSERQPVTPYVSSETSYPHSETGSTGESTAPNTNVSKGHSQTTRDDTTPKSSYDSLPVSMEGAQTVLTSLISQGTVTSSPPLSQHLDSTSLSFHNPQLSKLPFLENGTPNDGAHPNLSSSESHSTHSSPLASFATTSSSSATIVTPISSPAPIYPPPPPVVTTGGESIYRTIMNRLTALEANHTLYSRYMEEQTANVREMLKRLGEDVGRLEGIGKAQAAMYQRMVHDWERQRRRLEMEHGELTSRVNHLADEVVLEKRLGIAQLCLLLAVLVFMGLTRGSRGEPFMQHRSRINSSMREWGRRNLSFNGDWVSRLRSRSPTPKLARSSPGKEIVHTGSQLEFPSLSTRTSAMDPPISSKPRVHANTPGLAGRSRTPSSLRTPLNRHLNAHHRPATPTSRPQLSRSHSGGVASPHVIGPVPRSAKRWARSAHLHEVRSAGGFRSDNSVDRRTKSTQGGDRESDDTDRENELFDVFTTPGRRNGHRHHESTTGLLTTPLVENDGKVKSAQTYVDRRPLSPLLISRRQSEAGDDSAWVDTDADGSELEMSVGSASPHSARVDSEH